MNGKKKVYGIYVDVRCCTMYCKRRDCIGEKISSYCFEIFEMGGKNRGVGQPLIDLSIRKKKEKKCVVPSRQEQVYFPLNPILFINRSVKRERGKIPIVLVSSRSVQNFIDACTGRGIQFFFLH